MVSLYPIFKKKSTVLHPQIHFTRLQKNKQTQFSPMNPSISTTGSWVLAKMERGPSQRSVHTPRRGCPSDSGTHRHDSPSHRHSEPSGVPSEAPALGGTSCDGQIGLCGGEGELFGLLGCFYYGCPVYTVVGIQAVRDILREIL